MTTSVLINCYNYGRFVGEAIESVRHQTRLPDELIVVDDGSTDDSAARIDAALAGFSGGRRVTRNNGGQLAAFNTGFRESKGDILFFLDADDLYEPNHIGNALGVFAEHKHVGFVFTAFRRTNKPDQVVLSKRGHGDLGPSAILTTLSTCYIGNVTSCVAMRRSVAELFLPLPAQLEKEWITRADDCIVLGSSLTGTRKFFLPEPTVKYRVHGDNWFADRKQGAYDRYAHSLRISRLMKVLRERFSYDRRTDRLLLQEFRSIRQPSWARCLEYLKVAKHLNISLLDRLYLRIKLLGHFLRPSVRADS